MIDNYDLNVMKMRNILRNFMGYAILGGIMTDDKAYNRKLADTILKNIYKSFTTAYNNAIGDNKPKKHRTVYDYGQN